MKILPVIFGLLLLGLIHSSSDDVKDLEVLTEYEFVTGLTQYYCRVAVSSQDNMYLELKTNNAGNNYKGDFKLDVCGYHDWPSNSQVIAGHSGCVNDITPTVTPSGSYAYYRYTWSTIQDIYYLGFSLYMKRPSQVYPYTLYIYSEGMGIVSILLLLVLLPCIIIAAIIVAVCKFCCGGCRVRINAGGTSHNYI